MGVNKASSATAPGRLPHLWRMLRHLWLDADDARRAVPPALAESLAQRIAGSERRHSGEIRLCVEASLPLSDLWRVGTQVSLAQVIRQRALTMFGNLGVWDTKGNTGVLVYVLLAERAIEIVADRGLRGITADQWQAVADELAQAFHAGRQEAGLMEALARVDTLLAGLGLCPGDSPLNELPDRPHLQ